MRGRRFTWLAAALAASLVSSAFPQAALARPPAEIADAAHETLVRGFYFLPPMVAQPALVGTFDPSLPPVVRIEELGPAGGSTLVATFTTSGGSGDERVRVNAVDEYYIVNWHTRRFAIDPARTYRIRVLVAGTELGHADIDVVRSGAELKSVDTDAFVGVVLGSTLPVKFWIARRTVFPIGAGGGTVTALDGRVTLVVPPGAVSGEVGITVQPVTNVPQVGRFAAVAGSVVDLGPDGATFAQPIEVTLGYADEELPPGVIEELLGLFRFDGSTWQRVPGSRVDPAANTVTGGVTSFSTYGVVTFLGGVPTLSGFGTATLDGDLGSAEWAFAARVNFPAAIPGGGTTPATLLVMNDATNLYVAIRFDRAVVDQQNSLTFIFDNNDDGQTANGDDKIRYEGTPAAFAGFIDEHFSNAPPCPSGVFCAVQDTAASGTNDGAGVFKHHGTFSVYELSHPLDSADNAHDFSLAAGNSVGFFLALTMVDAQLNVADTFFPGNGIHGHIFVRPAALPVLSGRGTAAVNGAFGLGEWDRAACIFFSVNVPGGTTPAEFCVMNDAVNLYVALRFVRSAADPGNSFAVEFDNDNDGVAENGDDVILFNPDVGFVDDVRTNAPPCPSGSVPAQCAPRDTDVGGTTDGAGAFSNDGTNSTYEMSHPLDSADNANDFSLAVGDTVGFFLFLRVIGSGGVIVDTDFPGFRQYAKLRIAP